MVKQDNIFKSGIGHEASIFDIYTEEEVFEMITNKLLKNLANLKDKDILSIEEINQYRELISDARTIEQLNDIDESILNRKKFIIRKKSLTTYVMDYKNKNLLTDLTKDECLKIINSAQTLDDIELVERQIEEIIKIESTKIMAEYDKLVLEFNFDERKEEYIEKLKNKLYLIKDFDMFKDDSNNELLKIILNPKNSKELEYAEALFTFIIDINDMKGYNYKLDYSESLFLKLLIETYNSYNKQEYDEIKFDNEVSTTAQLLYEMIYIGLKGTYELLDSFKRKTGIDLNDNLESMKFELCLKELNNKFQVKTNPSIDSEEDMDKTINCFRKFHKIVLENQVDDYDKRR